MSRFWQTLDRGKGYTATALHQDNIAGMEVMLANGDVFRTGQFAQDGNPSAHLSKSSFGPSTERLFIQSNLGIVTKLGIWVSTAPEAYMGCALDVFKHEDLGPLVDLLSPLRRNGVLPNQVWVYGEGETLALYGNRYDFNNGERPIPHSELKKIQKQLDIGAWTALFSLTGPEDIVQAHYNEVKRLVEKKLPSGRLRGTLYSGGEDGYGYRYGDGDGDVPVVDSDKVKGPNGGSFVGRPNMDILGQFSGYVLNKEGPGVTGHMDFSPIMPSSRKAVLESATLTRKICDANKVDYFVDLFIHERQVILVNVLPY